MPDVAVVHDYVINRGGAERILTSIHRAFPESTLHAAFYRGGESYEYLDRIPIQTFPIDRIGWLRRHHRVALPLLPLAFTAAQIDADVVVCSTSGWSAGVRATGRKVLYVHAPTRWLNDRDAFVGGRPRFERIGLGLVQAPLRRWDRAAVRSADRILVPSRAMADELVRVYGVETEILAPPITLQPSGVERRPAMLGDNTHDFVFVASRLVASKNLTTLFETFRRRPGDDLVVAGEGPERDRFESTAPANVHLIGQADDDELRWLYRHSRCVVSAAHESFGLVPVEAAAFGRPAVALGVGGTLDTTIDGTTGVLFDHVDPDAISEAIDRADATDFDEDRLRAHATRWSEERFISELQRVVAEESDRS